MLSAPLNLPLHHLTLELEHIKAVIALHILEMKGFGEPQDAEGGQPALERAEGRVAEASDRISALLQEVPRSVLPL